MKSKQILEGLVAIEDEAKPSKNSIFFLTLVRTKGVWNFTDKKRGLVNEPFVSGMPEIIESILEDQDIKKKKAAKGLRVIFAAREFPGFHAVLKRGEKEGGGAWYKDKYGEEGWLCPATLKFFKKMPKKLWVAVSA